MIGFVDNSTCITDGDKNDTVKTLKEKMQEDAQLWHDLPWISGGKLELPKCVTTSNKVEFQRCVT